MPKKAPEPAYHHGNLREALLAAALQELGREGARPLSLRAIAAAVGVSVAAVYRHFPNKQALLAEVAVDGFRRLGELWERELPTRGAPGSQTRFQHLGELYIAFALASPAHFRLMFAQADIREYPALREAAERCRSYVHGVAQEAVMAAGADAAWVLPMADAAWSIVHGYVHLALEHLLSPNGEKPALSPALLTHFLCLPPEALAGGKRGGKAKKR